MRTPKPTPVHRNTILLTGFGPFPGVAENATAKLIPDLGRLTRRAFPAHRIVTGILPTEWQAAPARLKALIRRTRPTLVLHFGVAREAKGFRIETTARNQCRQADDARGAGPADVCLVASGPPQLPVTIPTRDIVRALKQQGLAADLSRDAGGYLCNAVLYHSLAAAAEAESPRMTGFIHIPAEIPGPHIACEEALAGGLELIRVCLMQAEARRR